MNAGVFDQRLKDFFLRYGIDDAVRLLRRRAPDDIAEFLSQLYEDLENIRTTMEATRSEISEDGEERLRSRVVRDLRALEYDATAEEDHSGHVDIIVKSRHLKTAWIGEAKVHGAYEHLQEGMLQVHTRYTSGREAGTGLILFVKNKDAKSVVGEWRKFLEANKPTGMTSLRDLKTSLDFVSIHTHMVSGLPFETRHMAFWLHYKPADKSAVASKKKAAKKTKKSSRAKKGP